MRIHPGLQLIGIVLGGAIGGFLVTALPNRIAMKAEVSEPSSPVQDQQTSAVPPRAEAVPEAQAAVPDLRKPEPVAPAVAPQRLEQALGRSPDAAIKLFDALVDPLVHVDHRDFYFRDVGEDEAMAMMRTYYEAYERWAEIMTGFAVKVALGYDPDKERQNPTPMSDVARDKLGVKGPSEEEIRDFYEVNKNRVNIGKDLAEARPQILQILSEHHVGYAVELKARELAARGRLRFLVPELPRPPLALDTEGLPARGSSAKDAILLVEASDFLCLPCREARRDVVSTLGLLPERVKYIHIPLPRTKDGLPMLLAQGAHCAQAQGEKLYWAYHEQAFRFEPPKGDFMSENVALPAVTAVAKDAGLDLVRFASCVTSQAARAAVTSRVQKVTTNGSLAMPTFTIDGRVIFPGVRGYLWRILATARAAKTP